MKHSTRPILPLPSNTAPSYTFICLKVPDDAEYGRLLLGRLRELATWTSYDRTGDDHASLVAQVWRETFNSYINQDACMTACIEFRNKPDDSCQIQVSCDAGATWSNAWRTDICQIATPEPIQYVWDDDFNRYTSTDGGKTFTPSNDTDPRFFPTNVPAPEGANPRCLSANGDVLFYFNLMVQIDQILDTAVSFFSIVTVITGAIAAFTGGLGAPIPMISGLISTLLAVTSTITTQIIEDTDFWTGLNCLLYCALETGTIWDMAAWSRAISMLREATFYHTGVIGEVEKVFALTVTGLLGSVGLNNAETQYSISDQYPCDSCDCPDSECVTYPIGDGWTVEIGDVQLDDTIIYTAAGLKVVYEFDTPVPILYAQYQDMATASNAGQWRVDYYLGVDLVRSDITFDGNSSNWDWFVEFSSGNVTVDRVEFIVDMRVNNGVITARNFEICQVPA